MACLGIKSERSVYNLLLDLQPHNSRSSKQRITTIETTFKKISSGTAFDHIFYSSTVNIYQNTKRLTWITSFTSKQFSNSLPVHYIETAVWRLTFVLSVYKCNVQGAVQYTRGRSSQFTVAPLDFDKRCTLNLLQRHWLWFVLLQVLNSCKTLLTFINNYPGQWVLLCEYFG